MKRFISSIVALGVGLILSGSIGAAASTTPDAQSSSTVTQQPVYRPVSQRKVVNYYTKIGPNQTHNYKVYRSGGAKSSAANAKPIATGRQYANQSVHITREETMADGSGKF